MDFSIEYFPEVCASKDETRYVLSQVLLSRSCDPGKGTLTASNGHLLVQVPCHMEPNDVEGLIPIDVVVSARKIAKKLKRETITICSAQDSFTLMDGSVHRRTCTDQYPEYANVIIEGRTPGPAARVFAFNSALLSKIAKALGSDILELQSKGDKQPIFVSKGELVPGELAVLMPCARPEKSNPIMFGEMESRRTI